MNAIDMRPLAAMVRRTHEKGYSFREMADRASRAGHTVSHSHLAALAKDQIVKPPNEAQMRAIAAAVDVGYEQVRTAMFASYYEYVPREIAKRDGHSRVAAAIPADLTAEEERDLARMIRAWVAAKDNDSPEH